MADMKKQKTYMTSAKGGSKSRLASLRIAMNSPFGSTVIRLTYPEEAVSWDSAL